MPQFIPSLVDPLLFTQSDGTALSLNDIRSFSDRLLADANTLLRKVLYGYSGSTSWQLDDKSFSDLGHNESGFGSHLTTPCDEELQRYYSHLETTTPQIKAAIMGTSAPDVTPDYSALASGHDQLLGMLLVFLVITGGPVPITEQELASLRIIDDEVHNRSLSIHNGSILLLSVRTNLDRSESIVVRALPQGVSQLLLDFLVLVRRPLINAIFRSGNLDKAFSLKDFLCAPANSAMHSDCANAVNG
ncbi:hypothetical protein GQ42DRAFT_156486 [Ramicandelaber brevisporus]|nr:hypothetical protein GQ42DRAFT_156486 [Ramicandelaber brevisporus]